MPKIARRLLVAAAAVAALTLSACSSPAESSTGPVEIEYWHINTEAFGAKTVDALIEQFNTEHPDVHVTGRFHDGYKNLLQALQTETVAGTPPDVSQIGYSSNQFVAESLPYVSLDDVDLSSMPEEIQALGQIADTQVAIPYGLSVLVVFYNADLLKQAGIDALPTDWDGWLGAAQQMKDTLGLPLLNFQQFAGDNFIPQAMVDSNGGGILSCEAGTPTAVFDSAEGVEAIGLIGSAVQDGLALNVTSDQAAQSFLLGQTGTLITSIASRASLESQADFDLQAGPLPSFGDKPASLPAGGNNLFVFSDTDEKKKASEEFISFLLTEDAVNQWVEGTGYLPPVEGAATEYIASNPRQKVAADSLVNVVPWVSFPGTGGLEAAGVMYDATQAIMLGGSPEAEWTGAAAKINELIAGETC